MDIIVQCVQHRYVGLLLVLGLHWCLLFLLLYVFTSVT